MAHRPFELPQPSAGTAPLVTGGYRWRWRGAVDALTAQLLEERERWFLWLPVALGAGIAIYFALPVEPPVWLGLVLLAPMVGLGLHLRGQTELPELAAPAALALAAFLLGLAIGPIHTRMTDAPVIERRGAYEIDGQIRLVEDRPKGQRLLLDNLSLVDVAPAATPRRVRVSIRTAPDTPLIPGDRIRLRAVLMPPSAPGEPGGFDFARHAYFQRLGGVGYAIGAVERIAPAAERSLAISIARTRQNVAARIDAAVPGDAGAVATALLTGLRGGIADHVWHDMQVAGIAHLLAISGLHLGLVAGTLFFGARIALALVPPVTVRLPTKKWAAGFALVGALGYLMLTGGTVPTQRAFIMTGLMLLAVMVDRNPFSMRLVAWAALVVLLTRPDSVLGASFQMSFAAVVGLIAVYETGVGRRPERAAGLDRRLALYVAGVALTTVVATVATAPFAVYHFGRLPTYGVVANLIAVPLTAFWIMPAGLVGTILMPLGGDALCYGFMGQGIELVLAVAATVADWPGAAVYLPRPNATGLVLLVVGGLWLCLWRTPWRRLGVGIATLGIAVAQIATPPDLLVDARAELVGARRADGRLALSPWKRDRWVTDGWLRTAGQAEPAPWPEEGGAGVSDLRCDPLGCVLQRHGLTVAFARRSDALDHDCRRADLVISWPRIEACPNTGDASEARLIGPYGLRHAGGVAVWLTPGGVETLTVRAARGERPWVRP